MTFLIQDVFLEVGLVDGTIWKEMKKNIPYFLKILAKYKNIFATLLCVIAYTLKQGVRNLVFKNLKSKNSENFKTKETKELIQQNWERFWIIQTLFSLPLENEWRWWFEFQLSKSLIQLVVVALINWTVELLTTKHHLKMCGPTWIFTCKNEFVFTCTSNFNTFVE